MANYLVEASAPGLAPYVEVAQRVREAAATAGQVTPVRHLSFPVPLGEPGFHVFEADTGGAVRAASERARSGNVRIVEALL